MMNVNERLKKNIQKYFKKVDEERYGSLSVENCFYAITCSRHGASISHRQTNYVFEREDSDGKNDILKDYRIRKLTPIECERLQGFPDDWTKYGKDGEVISDTQRYKCCGNAVTTNVITHIFDDWNLNI